MPENRYLFRLPVLDPKQHVTGYKLAFQKSTQGSPGDDDDSQHLLAFVAGHTSDIKAGLLFLEIGPAALAATALQTLAPDAAVLILNQSEPIDAEHVALATALHERGFDLALRSANLAFLKANELLLAQLSYLLISHGDPELTRIADFARQRQPRLRLIVDNIGGWREFDACAALGGYAVFEDLCLAPREMIPSSKKLGPQAQQILQLMQMVQGDADIRNVEKILKSDVTLSYKLLRYINSAGFGLEFEIESPRHAVAMLGYAPLFRWLLLLLARTNTAAFSPALMQAAMVRGRFAELLGQGILSRREAENLFVVGMFSFLDHLLGIPIQEVLRQLTLPEAVANALISREGVYGPILALAEACEHVNGGAADLAAGLSMTALDVNNAHLSALAWAQSIKM